jgi:murein DD-endopeptidase MepM/ murein hydrolase activator NlpD
MKYPAATAAVMILLAVLLMIASFSNQKFQHESESSRIALIAKELEIEDLENRIADLTSTDGYVVPGPSEFLHFPFYPHRSLRVTSQFHMRDDPFNPSAGPNLIEGGVHKGLDITTGGQTIILSTVTGTVVEHYPPPNDYWRGDGPLGGKLVIEDANGVQHVFAHLSETYVSTLPSERYVEAGDEIARMGATGMTTGAHLHYEIRRREGSLWVYYDPLFYFDVHLDDNGYVMFPESEAGAVLTTIGY